MTERFVKHCSSGNQFKIQLGQLAEQQATRQDVKQFAQKLVQDHQQAQQQLQQAAQSAKIEVPTELNEVHKAMLAEMKELKGQQFEKAFINGQAGMHLKAVLSFRDASQDLQDPQLKQFAQQALPKLQQHLQQTMQLARLDMGGAGEARPAGDIQPGERQPSDATTPDRTRPGQNRPDQNQPGQNQPGENRPGARPGADRPSGTDRPGETPANPSDRDRPQTDPQPGAPGTVRPGQ